MSSEFSDNAPHKNVAQPFDNVCMFSGSENSFDNDAVSATRFIYETSPQKLGEYITYPAFGCHLVTGGSATIVTENGETEIAMGDMFFSFPMIPFSFKNIDGLKYLYINFVGAGVESLLMSIGINREKSVKRSMSELIDTWFFALGRCSSENLSMLARGLIYYSLALIPTEGALPVSRKEEDIAETIRKSIDISYHNEDLSIDYYAKKYQYNSKYLSRKFADTFNVTFSEYLQTCRINRACVLLKETKKSIQEIASAVGYHDPLYFSKVFKKIMWQTPSEYRKGRL